MQLSGAEISRYRKELGLTQAQLADMARVHQSTVSRAEEHDSIRKSAGRSRICKYLLHALKAQQPLVPGERLVLEAFGQIWDHTEEHAKAVANLINALAAFAQPVEPKGGPGDR